MDFICPNNLLFACSKCGLCCGNTQQKTRHILLLELEANTISEATCLPKQAFTRQVEEQTPYCYEIKKDEEGKCLFLKDNRCTIYSLRPLICRFYPFELKFDQDKKIYVFDFTLECPEIGRGKIITRKDFKELFLLAKEKLP
ncbi:MAG: YkgJ family cysteine cluster protein [Bacillota bacterium]